MSKHFKFEKLRWKRTKSEHSLSTKKTEKKLRRNLRERERTNKIAEGFRVLSEILPIWLVGKDQGKLTKYKILKYGIEYTELLSRRLNQQDEIDAINFSFTSN